jgi:transcriptional regulator with XRE-family HTH domain
LRQRREELNYSQGAFVSASTLSQWEGGATPRAFEQLCLLAGKYGVSADYLLGLTDDPRPNANSPLSTEERELLELIEGLSVRTRRQLLAMVQALAAEEAAWRSFDVGTAFVESLYGEEYLAAFNERLLTLAADLGSMDAALDHLRARLLEEQPQQ